MLDIFTLLSWKAVMKHQPSVTGNCPPRYSFAESKAWARFVHWCQPRSMAMLMMMMMMMMIICMSPFQQGGQSVCNQQHAPSLFCSLAQPSVDELVQLKIMHDIPCIPTGSTCEHREKHIGASWNFSFLMLDWLVSYCQAKNCRPANPLELIQCYFSPEFCIHFVYSKSVWTLPKKTLPFLTSGPRLRL